MHKPASQLLGIPDRGKHCSDEDFSLNMQRTRTQEKKKKEKNTPKNFHHNWDTNLMLVQISQLRCCFVRFSHAAFWKKKKIKKKNNKKHTQKKHPSVASLQVYLHTASRKSRVRHLCIQLTSSLLSACLQFFSTVTTNYICVSMKGSCSKLL